MKTALIVVGILLDVFCYGAESVRLSPDPNIGLRMYGNEIADVREIVSWEAKSKTFGMAQAGPRPFPQWIKVEGWVFANEGGSVVVGGMASASERVRVKNPPSYPVSLSPIHKATYYARYVSGSVYDYGKPITEAERARMLAAPPVKQLSAEEKTVQFNKILAYQLDRASNGYPSYQVLIGKRYLTGDGVETNLALARHWLQSACTNGEPQATNLLTQIK